MTKSASHHFLLYAVYICQKSLNFIYAFVQYIMYAFVQYIMHTYWRE